jgi:diguanylate cyclase (GGDEF)-like protein
MREYKIISLQAATIREAEFQDQIRESCQGIITTFHQEELLEMMADKLPSLDINKCVFAMYEGQRKPLTMDNWELPKESRLLLGYDTYKGLKVISPEQGSFPTRNIIPDEMLDDSRASNWIMMPVFFNSEHFGYIVLEHAAGHPPFMYEELRTHIGSSIKSASMMDELKIQSMMDELTGVQNRRGFMSRGKKLLEGARTAGKKTLVFYVDLDKLKTINDTFGHEEGDAAIAGAANILKRTFRRNDVIGRIGGDEFCVILAMDNANEPRDAIMKRLQNNIEQINNDLGKEYKVSLTVGTSIFEPDHNKSLDEILKEADDRLLEKKRARKAAERKSLERS